MKVSVNWLREFTKIDMPVDELVEKIGAQLGAVEEVVDLTPKYQGIVVADVVSCEKHPNADKLSVCLIDDGGKVKGVKRNQQGLVQVVCGAPNVMAGMLVAWIPPGVVVPSSFDKEPFVIESREIRGQISNGMLASAHELDISDDQSGIVEFEDGKPGDELIKALKLDDYIIDIENNMFTHRPDCFGILGVAREVAGIQGKDFESPEWYKNNTMPQNRRFQGLTLEIRVENSISEMVPRFTAIAIGGLEVKPSPLWLQSFLSRVGIRPINNIVDLTNYYMVLTGQPLHAYDYDKLRKFTKSKTPKVVSLETRLSIKGEKLKLLGDKEITFKDNEAILITSDNRPVGIGGVMGGRDTEVDVTTKNIVLECANFDMYSIRRTSMAYGLFTDAVTRFSKGQSPLQTDRVIAKTAHDLEKITGGKIASQLIDEKARLKPPLSVHVRTDFINQRLGTDKNVQEMAKMLKNVEFGVRINGPTMVVTPPFWRTDIELPEDVVEEVGRLTGYDQLPMELPRRTTIPPERNELVDLKARIRTVLSSVGANEILTYSFMHGDLIKRAGQDVKKAFRLTNAISPDLHYYRISLIPSLLEKVHPNIKTGYDEFAIFEIGKTHNKDHIDKEEKLPREIEQTAFVYAAKTSRPGAALYRSRFFLDELLRRLNIDACYEPIKVEPIYQTAKPFEPKRSALVVDVKTKIALGIVGEFRSTISQALKLPDCVSGFELSTTGLLVAKGSNTYMPLSRFPSVDQDMTLQIPAELTFAELDKTVAAAVQDNPDVNNTDIQVTRTVFDIYQQKNGQDKHVTYRFRVTPRERTLRAGEVNTLLDKVALVAGKTLRIKRS